MDDFGVLVKHYGIKPQGKSSPMASSKSSSSTTTTTTTNNFVHLLDPSSFPTKPFSDNPGSFFFHQNHHLFAFNSTTNNPQTSPTRPKKNDSFSAAGADFDIDSMFKGSMTLNSKSDVNDDFIWGFSGNGSSNVVVGSDDLLSSDPVDDFFGKLGKSGSDHTGSKVGHTDDLLPGFGISNAKSDRAQAGSRGKSPSSSLDELEEFVTGGMKKTAKGHLNGTSAMKGAKKTSSSLDELEDFVTGVTNNTAKGDVNGFSAKKEAKKSVSQTSKEANFFDIDGSLNGDSVYNNNVEKASDLLFPDEATDLDTFFAAHTKKSVPVTDDMFTVNVPSAPPSKEKKNKQTNEVPDLFSETPFRMEEKAPPTGFPDDFSSIFGGASTSEVFEEIEGESEERRRARLGRYQRASARMAQALAEMNEREYQAQQEQEEKHRLADAMDVEMKRWAGGKEGNLRALLSSLQQVLAPELGWRPVTLTDLITSSQVKIAYKKAALCVHPDKVQQKGASLQQKFVAEKVFDLLKEAWNKFNTEELR